MAAGVFAAADPSTGIVHHWRPSLAAAGTVTPCCNTRRVVPAAELTQVTAAWRLSLCTHAGCRKYGRLFPEPAPGGG